MTRHVRFITLGCKVNQYETQAMREALERSGIRDASLSPDSHEGRKENQQASYSLADYVVINTCTVTKEADRENFYWIRRARRECPRAKIVVTGCFVERNRREIETLPDVDLVLSNHEKSDIASRLSTGCGSPEAQNKISYRQLRHRYAPLSISKHQGKARAFVKIQDGCNHACTFCKVVMVRGRSRSRPLTEVVEEAKRLCDAGYREIVLTGIQLGAYGMDLSPALTLREAVEACARIPGLSRLRLSSIEPTDVKPSLIETLRTIPQCSPHLHIPLQSGDDTVLNLMNRRYRCSFYRDLVVRLKSEIPDFSLTLDIMAGFPAEEETHFQNTLEFLEQVKPLKCHVFPYSKREGTRAAQFKGCDDAVIRRRVNQLIREAERLGREVRLGYIGREFPVLVEKETGKGRLIQGLTPNYLKVCFQGPREWIGQIVPVQLLALEKDIFLGKAVEAGKG
jgi:threonylcarbamoyladenosine tRNA methylthiotransferase MtaB